MRCRPAVSATALVRYCSWREIERDILRIGDQRAGRGAVQPVIIIVDDGQSALRLDQRDSRSPGWPATPARTRTVSGVGVGGEAVLIDLLVAQRARRRAASP